MRPSTVCSSLLAAIVTIGCANSPGPAAEPAPTLPPGFSVPQIDIATIAPVVQEIECDVLVAGFTELAVNPDNARQLLGDLVADVSADVPEQLRADIDALTSAIDALPPDASDPAALLAQPDVLVHINNLQQYVRAQCGQR
jgi:hypothetical protein